LKALLKSMSTRRNRRLNRCAPWWDYTICNLWCPCFCLDGSHLAPV
jgi:hypothetical protein